MKLLTYNFLTSKCIKGVKIGYPLKLNVCYGKNIYLTKIIKFLYLFFRLYRKRKQLLSLMLNLLIG